MKQSIKKMIILLAVGAVSLTALAGCNTEYDYAKSDAGKYDRPYTDGRDNQSDEDDESSDDQNSGSE